MLRPFVLTLKLDDASFQKLDALRRAHFPQERNFLAAHLTLIHALPGAEEAAVRTELVELCGSTPELELEFPGLVSLGGGVAVRVVCAALEKFHRELQTRFQPLLTAQDRQPLRPHVTIQNKVAPVTARHLLESLSRDWPAFRGSGIGVSLWRYEGGPWTLLNEWPFLAA